MDKNDIQQRARALAIKAARQDPELHDYTLDARILKPWEPHAWVVNAIAEALQGEIAPTPEECQDEPMRILAKVVDMIETRTEPLHRRIDRMASAVSMLAAEDRKQLLRKLEARIDAIGARAESLWAARMAPLTEEIGVINGKVERFATGLHDFLSTTDAQEKQIAREMVAERRGPPPGVPMIVLARCAPHGKSDCPECGAYAVVDPTAQAYERIVQERDGYRDGQERMTKARDAALKGCDDLGSRVTILQRELRAAKDLAQSAANQLNDEKNKRATTESERDEARGQREAFARAMTEERGKRMAAEASCTGHRGRVLELEAQLRAKDRLFESVSRSASEVPTLRETVATLTSTVNRMQPVCLSVEKWLASRGEGVGLSYAGPAQYAAAGADAMLIEAGESYLSLCKALAAGDPDDCQAGTCDCPSRPGTYDIAHVDGCKADPAANDDGMPF